MKTNNLKTKDAKKRKNIFFLLGILISLSISLVAFEWKTFYEIKKFDFDIYSDKEPQELIPIILTKEKPKRNVWKEKTQEIEVVDDLKIERKTDQKVKNLNFEIDTIPDFDPLIEPEVTESLDFIGTKGLMPKFPGGEAELMKYLNSIKYPIQAKEAGMEGMVILSMIIEKDGSVGKVNVLRGIGGGCDKASVNHLKNMPKWTPAKQNGIPVKVTFNVPIRFNLQ